MAKLDEALELLNTMILSIVDGMVKVNKATISDFWTCLQNAQDKIECLQLKSQLQQDELQQKSHHSELFFVQNKSLFEVDSH